MRKTLAFFTAILMLFGCMNAMAEDQPTIVATTYPLYDMARSICGDLALVQYAPDGAEDIASDADVLLCVGGEDDAWADALDKVVVVKAINGIDLIGSDTDVLTIPVNCMICASYFADAISALDAANLQSYQTNVSAYIERMSALDIHIRDAVSEGMKVSCSDGSMAYFAREYGLENAQGDASAAVLSTYNAPAEENLDTSYIDLLHENLHALVGSGE